jgi:hypothetical protein
MVCRRCALLRETCLGLFDVCAAEVEDYLYQCRVGPDRCRERVCRGRSVTVHHLVWAVSASRGPELGDASDADGACHRPLLVAIHEHNRTAQRDDDSDDELAWLLVQLKETLQSLKAGLEECAALLAPSENGSTLVLTSVRSESLKGLVTRVGTRIVKGVGGPGDCIRLPSSQTHRM